MRAVKSVTLREAHNRSVIDISAEKYQARYPNLEVIRFQIYSRSIFGRLYRDKVGRFASLEINNSIRIGQHLPDEQSDMYLTAPKYGVCGAAPPYTLKALRNGPHPTEYEPEEYSPLELFGLDLSAGAPVLTDSAKSVLRHMEWLELTSWSIKAETLVEILQETPLTIKGLSIVLQNGEGWRRMPPKGNDEEMAADQQKVFEAIEKRCPRLEYLSINYIPAWSNASIFTARLAPTSSIRRHLKTIAIHTRLTEELRAAASKPLWEYFSTPIIPSDYYDRYLAPVQHIQLIFQVIGENKGGKRIPLPSSLIVAAILLEKFGPRPSMHVRIEEIDRELHEPVEVDWCNDVMRLRDALIVHNCREPVGYRKISQPLPEAA